MRDRMLIMLLALAFTACGIAPALAQGEDDSKPNPDWEYYAFDLDYVNDAGGLSFEELARSKKPFVLVWWLSSCQLCRMQMPYVQELNDSIREHELDMYLVSINIDDRERDCRSYIAETGLSIPVLWDMHGRRTDKAYGLKDLGMPVTYVFGAGGEFIDTITGYKAGYSEAVLKLLDIPVPDDK
ncbi:TlpA family protein disulfide reductase [bacterium]|nr:TlpA family protein disulfide reductase [bacterium]